MPSTTSALRSVRLGQLLDADVPLGPLGDIHLTCHTPSSGKGKLHGDPGCSMLRSSHATQLMQVALREAVHKWCSNCRWPIPADSPLLAFVSAVAAVTDLKSASEPSPDTDFDETEELDAASALATGEYPQQECRATDDDTDECDQEAWDRFEQARLIRERHHDHWRYLHGYMLESGEAVAAFPWLHPWAAPLQEALAAAIERERSALADLLRPSALLETAVVPFLSEPELTPRPGFAGLGADAERILRRTWSSWQDKAARSWTALEDDDFAASSVLYDAFGRRRKGRDEAFAALDALVADWIVLARKMVAEHSNAPRQLVAIKIPAVEQDATYGHRRDPLSPWEAGLIATYQVAAIWPAGAAALLLPHLIAERLLMSTPGSMSVTRLDLEESGLPVNELLSHWVTADDAHKEL
ncbi:hypothetical protein [Streptomyces eurocidicus]|uniref:Uncharacterized protein n=2 Tax=Streptomyces eurocidicus TaxID=66423 RepID=A0A7W8BDK2_STREU|nr:hypothetical protein [Streptomyces eurocidicus]MBB5120833.1 hypothetical protein [Streptomyces eurocidicus]MBF6054467.1 hypothetical protein [Streptomyces eurocidicus]